MSQTLADDSEVVFEEPEESAGAMEPEGPLQNRHKEEAWLEATEPYRGVRARTMEFDRPVDGGLGATLGGKEDKDKLRDGVVPELRRNSKFSTRRRYRHHRKGNHVETRVINQGDLGLR